MSQNDKAPAAQANSKFVSFIFALDDLFPFHLFLYEFVKMGKALLQWLAGLTAGLVILLAFFPFSARSNLRQYIVEQISVFPDTMLEALDLTVLPDLNSFPQYLAVFIPLLFIALYMFACWLGASSLVGEEIDGTLGTLYALPVRRSSIVTVKLASRLAALLLMNMVLILFGGLFGNFLLGGVQNFFGVMASFLGVSILIQLIYFMLGFLFSSWIKTRAAAVSIALWTVVLTGSIGILAGFLAPDSGWMLLCPISYGMPFDILKDNFAVSAGQWLCAAGIFIASGAVTYLIYRRRDLLR